MNRLDSYTPLGYSLCGVVTEVGVGAEEFKVGQLVAAAGNEYALHAEYNWIPVTCAPRFRRASPPSTPRSPPSARSPCRACGAQSSSLARLPCVIGLGLVGQLVVRLLIAAGVRVVGLDTIEDRCRLAEQAGAVLCAAPAAKAWTPCAGNSLAITGGRGVDHVFLTVGGSLNAQSRPQPGGKGPRPGRRHRQDQT